MPEELKPELLPCPWCEGTRLRVNPATRCMDGYVQCLTCRSEGPVTAVGYVEAWNTRPASELERLAREVTEARWGSAAHSHAYNALRAYFAEPSQKGTVDGV